MQHYDYIFTGGGLSGLMTAWRMVRHPHFRNANILIIDRDEKVGDDRTWCFWENGAGEFEQAVSHRWHNADFKSSSVNRRMVLAPFAYKMIRSSDLYEMLREDLLRHDVAILQDDVIGFSDAGNQVIVSTTGQTLSCRKLLNSLPNLEKVSRQNEFPLLLQHFIGWRVRTENAIFDPKAVTFMDFTVPQKGNTRFMYVLPISENEALVEYTLFSKDILPDSHYESAMDEWLAEHNSGAVEILETERGAIPMTCFKFERFNTLNILNIGSAGGWTKASTGFTFANTVRKSSQVVELLANGADFRNFSNGYRYRFYDTLLLDILSRNNELGSEIFSAIFKKSDPATIFRFLDETASFQEDMAIIKSCPKRPFVGALFHRLLS